MGTYGHWLRKKAPGAVDLLDDEPISSGSKVVAVSASGRGVRRNRAAKLPPTRQKNGDPPGTRTPNLEIKSLIARLDTLTLPYASLRYFNDLTPS